MHVITHTLDTENKGRETERDIETETETETDQFAKSLSEGPSGFSWKRDDNT